jgi:hypothetical protein
MNWKMCKFLPDIVQENFEALIAGFLASVSEAIKNFVFKQLNKSQIEVIFFS